MKGRNNNPYNSLPIFSNSQIIGFSIVLAILAIVHFSKIMYTSFGFASENEQGLQQLKLLALNDSIVLIANQQKERAVLDSLEQIRKKRIAKKREDRYASLNLVEFDPNSVDSLALIAMGFSAAWARTFLKFRRKGAVFYKKEDIQRSYVIDSQLYARLAPFIKIEPRGRPSAKDRNLTAAYVQRRKPADIRPRVEENTTRARKTIARVDLNSADTTQLKQLKHIGSFRAAKLVEYRNQIGGFVDVKQLEDVWFLPDSVAAFLKDRFTLGDQQIRKYPINEIPYDSLAANPIFRRGLAYKIVGLRYDLRSFQSLDQLELLKDVSEEDVEILKSYFYIR